MMTTATGARVEKFRPAISEAQLEVVVSLLQGELEAGRLEAAGREALAVLAPFLSKVQFKGVKPAWSKTASGSKPIADSYVGMSIPEKQLACFRKWQQQGAATCNADELEIAASYRYLNSLMTAEEMQAMDDAIMAKIGI